jgi:hypothetical protein
MMAGFAIHATWSRGPIDAWFDAGLDFLLSWKPFHYEAHGYVAIGVSLSIDVLFGTIRITAHIGVGLDVWGPPFGGRAVIDLDVISFAIGFGSSQVADRVDWSDFRQFLPSVNADPSPVRSAVSPANDNGNLPLVNVFVSQGLLKAFKPGESKDGLDWLVDPNGFQIVTESTPPCSDATFQSSTSLRLLRADDYLDPANIRDSVADAINHGQTAPFFAYKPGADGVSWTTPTFGIPPLGRHNIQSIHTVNVQMVDSHGEPGTSVADLIVTLQTKAYAQGLWGNFTNNGNVLGPGNELIHDSLSGFRIEPMLWFPKRTTFIPYYFLVFDTNDIFVPQDVLPAINTSPFPNSSEIYAALESGAAFSRTAPVRAGIVSVLQDVGFKNLVLTGDLDLNTEQYTGDPLLAFMSHTGETSFAA